MKCSGRLVSSGEWVVVEAGNVIHHVEPQLNPLHGELGEAGPDREVWLAPGFIDLQVNGFAGVDYNSPESSSADIARSIRRMYQTGVARLFPTVITGPPERMLASLRNLARVRRELLDAGQPEGASMEAFHVEGPHISPEDGPRGAHPAEWVRPPDLDEFRRWQEAAGGNVRIVTLAPEWPGAMSYIDQLTSEGVVVSIGHTGATPERIREAAAAGATMSTHLGNGADRSLPRHPNYLWEQLSDDRLAASFIVDGLHLPESFLKVALRAKGAERSILVTDAVMPAMCEPGVYQLGGVAVELCEDGRVVLQGGTRLAGSSLRMDRAIGGAMRIAGASLTEAVAMATVNPARVGRIPGRQRGINPGERADAVRFEVHEGLVAVRETWVAGERVF